MVLTILCIITLVIRSPLTVTGNQQSIQLHFVMYSSPGKLVRYAIHHVPADGNCMFSAIAHQIKLGPRISESSTTAHHQVRLEIVEYLRNHPDIVSIQYIRT